MCIYINTGYWPEHSFKFMVLHMAQGLPLLIIFDKVEGYIRKYDRTKYLALFHPDEKYERIFDRIRNLITLKGDISDVYFWTRDVSRTASYEITLVPLSVGLSLSFLKLSQDWIISFF